MTLAPVRLALRVQWNLASESRRFSMSTPATAHWQRSPAPSFWKGNVDLRGLTGAPPIRSGLTVTGDLYLPTGYEHPLPDMTYVQGTLHMDAVWVVRNLVYLIRVPQGIPATWVASGFPAGMRFSDAFDHPQARPGSALGSAHILRFEAEGTGGYLLLDRHPFGDPYRIHPDHRRRMPKSRHPEPVGVQMDLPLEPSPITGRLPGEPYIPA